MSEFLWRELSEKEKAEIERQAKEIMESFSNKIGKVADSIDEASVERGFMERSEGEEALVIDREIMFSNAKEKNEDFIIAEKKKW